MGVVVRQALKGTVVAYVGVLIGIVNTLWLMPYVLSAEQIGLYRVFIDIATFLMIFSQLGMLNAGIRFFPHFKDKSKNHNGFLFFMLMTGLAGILVIAALFLVFQQDMLSAFAKNSGLLLEYDHLILPLTLLLLFFAILETYSRSLLRIVIPKLFRDVILRLLISIIVILYFFHLIGQNGFMISLVIAHLMIVIGIMVYLKWMRQLFLKPDFSVFKSDKIKEIAVYCLFTIMVAGSGIIVGKIDTIMVSSLSGLTSTGIYSIAFYMGVMVEIPKRSLAGISSPLVAKHFKEGVMDEIHILYKKTSTHLMLAAGFILVLIWFNIDDVFALMPNSEIYVQGKYVVLFIGLAKLADLSMGINTEILSNSPKYRWNLFLMPALAVLAVVTNLILIPIYGLTGAAIASFISITAYNIIRFIIVFYFYRLHPFSFQTVKSLAILAGLTFLAYFIPEVGHPIVNILLKSAVLSIVAVVAVLILKPSEELNALFNRTLEIIFKKRR